MSSSAYWDTQPCNVHHSDKPIGSREYSEEVTARKYFVEPHIPPFADFERWRGKRVLEIGCGIGTDAISFAQHGAEVTAIDSSQKSLDIAAERAKAMDIKFSRYNAEEWLPSGHFDLIYCFGVLHHMAHPAMALFQIRWQSQDGTVVKLMLYHRHSWKALRIWLGIDRPEAQAGCPIARTYSRSEARRMLDQAGFVVTEMRVEHIFPYAVAEYRQYRYRKLWYWRWMPAPLFRLLEQTVGWHLLITAVPK